MNYKHVYKKEIKIKIISNKLLYWSVSIKSYDLNLILTFLGCVFVLLIRTERLALLCLKLPCA